MEAIPFALSVSHFVNSVGADAGFAAIIGLAILVLLYFAQARETASLRDRANASADQVEQLELRLAQLARVASAAAGAPGAAPAPVGLVQRGAKAPAPAAAAAMPAASRAAASAPLGGFPSAPAGVGAPSFLAATRLIPNPADGAISIRATGASTAAAAGAGAAAGAPGTTAGAPGATAPAKAPATAAGGPPPVAAGSSGRGNGAGVLDPAGPAPSTAAGGANGDSRGFGDTRGRIPTPTPAPPPAPPPASVRTGVPPRAPAPRTASGGHRFAPPVHRRRAPAPGRRGIPSGVLVLAGLVGVAAVVVALIVLTSGGSSTKSAGSASTPISNAPTGTHKKGSHAATALTPADVTVAVLNGTSTTNLAHDTGVRLRSLGYKTGTIATATDQTLTATVVGYRSGAGHRREAVLVAHSLGLGPASVQPVDQSNEAVACPQTSTCTAQVVVTVGSDLASTASTTPSAASTT